MAGQEVADSLGIGGVAGLQIPCGAFKGRGTALVVNRHAPAGVSGIVQAGAKLGDGEPFADGGGVVAHEYAGVETRPDWRG